MKVKTKIFCVLCGMLQSQKHSCGDFLFEEGEMAEILPHFEHPLYEQRESSCKRRLLLIFPCGSNPPCHISFYSWHSSDVLEWRGGGEQRPNCKEKKIAKTFCAKVN
uniref:Uncharacterized protein n=1 Tax=Sphaerodactylus townsendi TaxID=933632 RepID=A0ACB8FHE5_9SAUR